MLDIRRFKKFRLKQRREVDALQKLGNHGFSPSCHDRMAVAIAVVNASLLRGVSCGVKFKVQARSESSAQGKKSSFKSTNKYHDSCKSTKNTPTHARAQTNTTTHARAQTYTTTHARAQTSTTEVLVPRSSRVCGFRGVQLTSFRSRVSL